LGQVPSCFDLFYFYFIFFILLLISVLNCAWNREWEGLNHVLWEAAGDNNIPLVKVFLFIYLFIYFYF